MSDLFNKLVLRRKGTVTQSGLLHSSRKEIELFQAPQLSATALEPGAGPFLGLCATTRLGLHLQRDIWGTSHFMISWRHQREIVCPRQIMGSENCQGGALQGEGETAVFVRISSVPGEPVSLLTLRASVLPTEGRGGHGPAQVELC